MRMPSLALLRTGSIFSLTILLSSAMSFVTIPLVITIAGAHNWAGLAVGQSVGALFGIAAAYGWGVLGPASLAAMEHSRRGAYYVASLSSRLLLCAALVGPYVAVVWVVSPAGSMWIANTIAGGTILLTSLGASWYFIGEAKPVKLLVFDTGPRLIAVLIGSLLLWQTKSVYALVWMQLAGEAAVNIISTTSIRRQFPDAKFDFNLGATISRLKTNSSGVVTSMTAAVYVQLPLLIISTMHGSGVSAFALADKLEKFSLRVLSPVVQVAQGAVPNAASQADLHRRIIAARKLAAAMAIAASFGFALAVPRVADTLSAGEIKVGYELSIPLGIAVGCVVTTGIVGLAGLIPLGRGRAVASSTVAGAIVGLPLAIGLAHAHGSTGVAWSVAIAELTVTSWQIFALRQALQKLSTEPLKLDDQHLEL